MVIEVVAGIIYNGDKEVEEFEMYFKLRISTPIFSPFSRQPKIMALMTILSCVICARHNERNGHKYENSIYIYISNIMQ